MKIMCDKNILIEAVNIVSKAVSSKSTLPVLEGILIETKNDKITLTGNDLELAIEHECTVQVIEEGKVVLNARMFGEIIRKLPDAPVFIETDDKFVTKIKCSNVNFDILGLDASEYPKIPQINKNDSITINQRVLKSLIKQTIFAISTNDKKPIWTGSLFEIENNKISVVSTDGFLMAIRNENIEENGKNIRVIVPGKTLNELLKIISDDDLNVKIYFSEKHILFEFENFTVTSRLRDGEYTNYKNVIEKQKSFEIELKVDTANVLSSLERAALIINADSAKSPLKLDIRDDEINVNCSSQIGKISDVINADALKSGELLIGLNQRYLYNVFRNCEKSEVLLDFISSRNPCIVRPVEGEEFIYMVMPINIQSQ